jgi:hypothetical protein
VKRLFAAILFVVSGIAHAGNCDSVGYNGEMTLVSEWSAYMMPGHFFGAEPVGGGQWHAIRWGSSTYRAPLDDIQAVFDDSACHAWITVVNEGIFFDGFDGWVDPWEPAP